MVRSLGQVRPELDLTGDRALCELGGQPSVEDELVGYLDGLAHRVMVAFCYRAGKLSTSGIPCTQRRGPSPYTRTVGDYFGRFEAGRSLALRPVGLPSRHSDQFVPNASTVSFRPLFASMATGWSDPVAASELHPLKINTFARCTNMVSPV